MLQFGRLIESSTHRLYTLTIMVSFRGLCVKTMTQWMCWSWCRLVSFPFSTCLCHVGAFVKTVEYSLFGLQGPCFCSMIANILGCHILRLTSYSIAASTAVICHQFLWYHTSSVMTLWWFISCRSLLFLVRFSEQEQLALCPWLTRYFKLNTLWGRGKRTLPRLCF